MRARMLKSVLTAAAATVLAATVADAKCTRLGFSVNDYGKDGPTKDARDLLDKYIAKWAVDHGVKNYTTGKKDVKCELFLDFLVFDEHTCRAEATVCWGEGKGPAGTTAAVTPAVGEAKPAAAKPAAKPAAKAPAAKPEAPKAKAATAG